MAPKSQWTPFSHKYIYWSTEKMYSQFTLRTHFPAKIAMRTLSVLEQAPRSSVLAITWVTFELQLLVTVMPVRCSNLSKISCEVMNISGHITYLNKLWCTSIMQITEKTITLSWPLRADPHITHSLVITGGAVQNSLLCIGEGEFRSWEGEFRSSISDDGLGNQKKKGSSEDTIRYSKMQRITGTMDILL